MSKTRTVYVMVECEVEEVAESDDGYSPEDRARVAVRDAMYEACVYIDDEEAMLLMEHGRVFANPPTILSDDVKAVLRRDSVNRLPIHKQIEAAIIEKSKRPPKERFQEMVDRGVINHKGEVLPKSPWNEAETSERQAGEKPMYFTLERDVEVPTSEWNYAESGWGADEPLKLAEGSRFVLRDGEYWTHEASSFPLVDAQAAIVKPLLKEAEPRIGQWIESSPGNMRSIVAALGELGIVSEADVRRAADYVADQDPHDLGAIERRNWIIYYPEG